MLNSLSKIALKRLKRKRKLIKRVKCHGNKISHELAHPVKLKKPSTKKESWLKRLKDYIKEFINRTLK